MASITIQKSGKKKTLNIRVSAGPREEIGKHGFVRKLQFGPQCTIVGKSLYSCTLNGVVSSIINNKKRYFSIVLNIRPSKYRRQLRHQTVRIRSRNEAARIPSFPIPSSKWRQLWVLFPSSQDQLMGFPAVSSSPDRKEEMHGQSSDHKLPIRVCMIHNFIYEYIF